MYQLIRNDAMKYKLSVTMQPARKTADGKAITELSSTEPNFVVKDMKELSSEMKAKADKRQAQCFEARMLSAYFTAEPLLTNAKTSSVTNDRDQMKERVEADFRARSGMGELRSHLEKLKNMRENAILREKYTGVKTTFGRMHMTFLGNAGTGKTTAAKLAKDYMYAHGMIRNNTIHNVMVKDLTSKYSTGHGDKAQEVMNKAIGSVLFIDEAYQLAGKEAGGSEESPQAITILLSFLEQYEKPDEDNFSTVVILGGYEAEMQKLWNKNQGLQSRFAGTIHFPDFPPCTLTEIAVKMMAHKHVCLQGPVHAADAHRLRAPADPITVLPIIWEYVRRYRAQFKSRLRNKMKTEGEPDDDSHEGVLTPKCENKDCYLCQNPHILNKVAKLEADENSQEWGNARSIGNMVSEIIQNRDVRLTFMLEEMGETAAFVGGGSANSGSRSNRRVVKHWTCVATRMNHKRLLTQLRLLGLAGIQTLPGCELMAFACESCLHSTVSFEHVAAGTSEKHV